MGAAGKLLSNGCQIVRQHGGRLSCLGAGGLVGVSAVCVGGSLGARSYVERTVVPQVEQALETSLQRQVALGELQWVLPWQVTVGESQIENLASIRSIDIRVDVWRWLWRRELAIALQLNQPNILIAESLDRGWMDFDLDLNGAEQGLPLSEVAIEVEGGQVTLLSLGGNSYPFDRLRARVLLPLGEPKDPAISLDVDAKFEGRPVGIDGDVRLQSREVQLTLKGDRLPVTLLSVLPIEHVFQLHGGTAQFNVEIGWQPGQPFDLGGWVDVANASFSVTSVPQWLQSIDGRLNFSDRQTLSLQAVTGRYGQVPFAASGTVTIPQPLTPQQIETQLAAAEFHLQGHSDRLTLSQLQNTFALELPFPVAGSLEGEAELTGPVVNPRLSGHFKQRSPASIDRLSVATYRGNFAVEGDAVAFTDMVGQLEGGGTVRARGTIPLSTSQPARFPFQLTGIDIGSVAASYELPELPKSLGTLASQGILTVADQPAIAADWQARGGEIEGTGRLDWQNDTTTIPQAELELAGGTATLSAVVMPLTGEGRAFSARVMPQGVALDFFVPEQPGTVRGDFSLRGSSARLDLAGLELEGTMELPDGIDRLAGAVSARVAWDGSTLAVSDGLWLEAVTVEGTIPFDAQTQQVGAIDLALSAQNLPLASLPLFPAGFPLEGTASLQGKATGRPDELQWVGQLGLENLQAAGLQFASLQGPLQWQPGSAGVLLDLRDSRAPADESGDRIALQLDADWAPQSFVLRRGITTAAGQRNGDRFDATLNRFPLGLLNGVMLEGWGGTLDSQFVVDLAARTVVGSASANHPSWRGIQANRLEGEFTFADGTLAIANGQMGLLDSLYTLNGSVRLPADGEVVIRSGRRQQLADIPLQVDLAIATENGKVENVLTALRWQEWTDAISGLPSADLGSASSLVVPGIELAARSLLERLESYTAIASQHAARLAALENRQIPDLSQLQGDFQGTVRMTGSLDNPAIQFDLNGQEWHLAEFQLDRLAARGRYRQGELELNAFNARAADRVVSLEGQFGDDRQQGYLTVRNFPLALANRFFPGDYSFSGELDAVANISGTLANPAASGQFDLESVEIDNKSIHAAGGRFEYRQGMLHLDGAIVASADFPIADPTASHIAAAADVPIAIPSPPAVTAIGTLPAPLPFTDIEPVSQEISLAISARDEQLGLVNFFTDAIAWQSGRGELDIRVGGTLQDPTVRGKLELDDATVALSALPEPIQHLQAAIAFNSNRLNVQSFSGSLSDGRVSASGLLAINRHGALQVHEAPLSVTLEQLELDLPDLYKGEVNGLLAIGGTLTAPELGGEITLRDGTISIPSGSNRSEEPALPWTPRFNQLALTLDDRVQVARIPLFAFSARGDLILNGTPDDVQPEGTIDIRQGYVNLGITNLRVDRGRTNTVVFDRAGGIDPLLDLRVFTEVREMQERVVTRSLGSSDTSVPNNLTEQDTIQIRADLQGRASELAGNDAANRNIIQLSSSPNRTPDEIVALLGGASLGGIGQGGIAGFALSTFVFGAQNAIGNLIGLDELRVAPFTGESGSLEVGLEAAKDLGAGVSVSVQQSLTDTQEALRFNTRFRLNDRLLLRSGTDFEGNDRLSLEFETKF